MFFSLLYFVFIVIILTQSGCKIRKFSEINQEIALFISQLFVFFIDFDYFCTQNQRFESQRQFKIVQNIKDYEYD